MGGNFSWILLHPNGRRSDTVNETLGKEEGPAQFHPFGALSDSCRYLARPSDDG